MKELNHGIMVRLCWINGYVWIVGLFKSTHYPVLSVSFFIICLLYIRCNHAWVVYSVYIYIIQECMYIFKSDVYIYIYTRKYTCDGRHQCSRKQDVVFLEMLEMSGNLLLVWLSPKQIGDQYLCSPDSITMCLQPKKIKYLISYRANR